MEWYLDFSTKDLRRGYGKSYGRLETGRFGASIFLLAVACACLYREVSAEYDVTLDLDI
jgi:hypothetical protein